MSEIDNVSSAVINPQGQQNEARLQSKSPPPLPESYIASSARDLSSQREKLANIASETSAYKKFLAVPGIIVGGALSVVFAVVAAGPAFVGGFLGLLCGEPRKGAKLGVDFVLYVATLGLGKLSFTLAEWSWKQLNTPSELLPTPFPSPRQEPQVKVSRQATSVPEQSPKATFQSLQFEFDDEELNKYESSSPPLQSETPVSESLAQPLPPPQAAVVSQKPQPQPEPEITARLRVVGKQSQLFIFSGDQLSPTKTLAAALLNVPPPGLGESLSELTKTKINSITFSVNPLTEVMTISNIPKGTLESLNIDLSCCSTSSDERESCTLTITGISSIQDFIEMFIPSMKNEPMDSRYNVYRKLLNWIYPTQYDV